MFSNRTIIQMEGHGDQQLIARLLPLVTHGLIREPVEWRRSHGWAPRTIYTEVHFIPFSTDKLYHENNYMLLGRTFFHIYWTECDTDGYKSGVKNDIGQWLSALRSRNIHDWLIVTVESDDRMKNKILRTSVYDKVKSDFCNKHSERCFELIEPFKADSKAIDALNALFARIRQLLLDSYSHHVMHFEEYMRSERENRTATGWSYWSYFLLQEQLAFMYEMLALPEEALIQYDELDALFTQFAVNHIVGDKAEWLVELCRRKPSSWTGIQLVASVNLENRVLIQKQTASLIDFRNYLFSRQCLLLFMLHRAWEVAERTIPTIHNCVLEIAGLQIETPPAAMDCWALLSCMEVLLVCERNSPDKAESNILQTATLRDFTRQKLYELAVNLGMFAVESDPGPLNLSEILKLLSTSTESPHLVHLRKALSSRNEFATFYLELSEMAMGTFKLLGRLRMARSIGKDIAAFYMKMNEPRKAEALLLDSLNAYLVEGWGMLADDTLLELVKCYARLDDFAKLMNALVRIVGSPHVSKAVRSHHMQQMLSEIKAHEIAQLNVSAKPMFEVSLLSPTEAYFTEGQMCRIKCNIVASLTSDISVDSITVFLSQNTMLHPPEMNAPDRKRASITSSVISEPSLIKLNNSEQANARSLKLVAARGDDGVYGFFCRQAVMRSFSSGRRTSLQDDIDMPNATQPALKLSSTTLHDGNNVLVLEGKVDDLGSYSATHLVLQIANVNFVADITELCAVFDVICNQLSVEFLPVSSDLHMGIPEQCLLQVTIGSALGTNVQHRLTVRSSPVQVILYGSCLDADGSIVLPISSEDTHSLSVALLCPLTSSQQMALNVEIEFTCLPENIVTKKMLKFINPFAVKHELHTSENLKFLQITITNNHPDLSINFKEPQLTLPPSVLPVPLFQDNGCYMCGAGQWISYLWQLTPNQDNLENSVNGLFACCYFSSDWLSSAEVTKSIHVNELNFAYNFQFPFYLTQFIVDVEITSKELNNIMEEKAELKGLVLLREGASHNCKVSIENVNICNSGELLLYQVQADRQKWSVLGKTSDVIRKLPHRVNFELIPLVSGDIAAPSLALFKYLMPKIDDSCNTETAVNDSELNENQAVTFDPDNSENSSNCDPDNSKNSSILDTETNTAACERNASALCDSDEVTTLKSPSVKRHLGSKRPSFTDAAAIEQANDMLSEAVPGIARFLPKLCKFRPNEVFYRAQCMRVHVLPKLEANAACPTR